MKMDLKEMKLPGITFTGDIHIQGDMFNIHDNQNVTINMNGKQQPTAKPAEEAKKDTAATKVQAAAVTPVAQETFADRVKAIMRKAASKNGQRIETSAKGHAGAYIYNIDAEAFCKAMDEMAASYEQKLKEFLGGSMTCVQVTKVCFFIGHVIRMNIINDTNLQMADIVFAFADYYNTPQTVKAKLGDKKTTSEQDVFFGTFEGLLKKYKA